MTSEARTPLSLTKLKGNLEVSILSEDVSFVSVTLRHWQNGIRVNVAGVVIEEPFLTTSDKYLASISAVDLCIASKCGDAMYWLEIVHRLSLHKYTQCRGTKAQGFEACKGPSNYYESHGGHRKYLNSYFIQGAECIALHGFRGRRSRSWETSGNGAGRIRNLSELLETQSSISSPSNRIMTPCDTRYVSLLQAWSSLLSWLEYIATLGTNCLRGWGYLEESGCLISGTNCKNSDWSDQTPPGLPERPIANTTRNLFLF